MERQRNLGASEAVCVNREEGGQREQSMDFPEACNPNVPMMLCAAESEPAMGLSRGLGARA